MPTVDEIFEAIEAAPPGDKVATAERMLAEYDGDDKDLIEPDVLETAFMAAQDQ